MQIPWGPIFIVGGLALVFATDLPSFIGWIAVGIGILMTLVGFIALLFVGRVTKKIRDSFDSDDFFNTNFGRSRPTTQRTLVRGVRSGGDVTVAPRQKEK